MPGVDVSVGSHTSDIGADRTCLEGEGACLDELTNGLTRGDSGQSATVSVVRQGRPTSGGCRDGSRVMTGTGLVVGVITLLLLALVAFATLCGTSSPPRYVNEAYAFSIELGRGLDVAGTEKPAATGPHGFERPDLMVAFADLEGPLIDGAAADLVDVKAVDLGAPVARSDPRLDDLPELLDATLASRGAAAVRPVPPIHIANATTSAAQYTDLRGRHGMTCMVVAGRHLYTLDVLATQRTRDAMWPALTKTLASFHVEADTAGPSPPRTYVDEASGLSITCDRRFMRLTITRSSWAAEAMFVFADPLSGVAENGRFNDGLVVYTAVLPGWPSAEQRRHVATDVRSGLERCGMTSDCRARPVQVNGLPAYRLCAHRRDGSGDLIYVVFSGDTAYFVEGCAQASTWATDRRLFEAAMRSVEVIRDHVEAALRPGPSRSRVS